jgi:hypothetical protein
MRWPHGILVAAALVLMLGLFGLQIWLTEQQTARLRNDTARYLAVMAQYRADMERQQAKLAADQARYLADLRAWQARKDKAGPFIMPPLPPVPSIPPPMPMPMPPAMTQPPVFFPWFPLIFPLILAPLALAEQQKLQKLQHQEEEDRTPYTVEDLMENWEFKIIRCPIPLFEKPAFLENVLREEARAGWQLVEKFDGQRVRLKRLAGLPPAADLPAGYDPYRTAIPWKLKSYIALWVLCIGCLILIGVFILLQIFDPIAVPACAALIGAAAGGAIMFGWSAVRQAAKYRTWASSAFGGDEASGAA